MSNHITATDNKPLILQYLNGIRTMIIGNGYDPLSVMNSIIVRMQRNKEQIVLDIKEALENDDSSSCGYVWHIDYDLNRNYNLSQCLLGPNDLLERSCTYCLPYPYDLGESEKVEDIKKYYPNYEYPHKI